MRKMRPNYTFKPRLVASGEWSSSNNSFFLDNNLETNKLYLIKLYESNSAYSTTFILSTIVDFTNTDISSFMTCMDNYSTFLSIPYKNNKNLGKYITMNTLGADYDYGTCHVYELYIG